MTDKKDAVAYELYGCSYNSLSSWAQMSVIATISKSDDVTDAPTGLQEDALNHRIATLQDQLSLAKKENHDLWEENEQLKMLLEEQRGNEE